MGSRLITVHAGPLWEVQLLRGQLEAVGVPAVVPRDSAAGPYDPSAVVSPPGTTLQVPEEYADKAMALIERNRKVAEQGEPEGSSQDLETTIAPEARLGRLVRWLALLILTAPLALVLGVVYLARLPPGRTRPPQHGLTVAAILVAVPLTAVLVLGVAVLLGWEGPPWA